MGIIHLALAFLKAFFAGRAAVAAENLALRHQPAVFQRSGRCGELPQAASAEPESWGSRLGRKV